MHKGSGGDCWRVGYQGLASIEAGLRVRGRAAGSIDEAGVGVQ